MYVDGRRVADIPIEDAERWRNSERHVVWIGLLEPDDPLLPQGAAAIPP